MVKNIVSGCNLYQAVTFWWQISAVINKNMKQLIPEKNKMYERFVKENKDRYLIKLNISNYIIKTNWIR